jgi:hypothetical protein
MAEYEIKAYKNNFHGNKLGVLLNKHHIVA